ncbi:MAG: TatD family hydrolase [Pseudomonadota bacterium]
MLIDSHCHLDRIDLTPYEDNFSAFVAQTLASGVEHMLCVCINLEAYPAMRELVADYPQISLSVGVHPCEQDGQEPTETLLTELAQDPKNVAIGETGLDYFHTKEHKAQQQERFRCHIRAARAARKPLIVHTRQAPADTIRLLREENAAEVGGVLHCFSESWEIACQAIELGFYISFSGVVTFKNAQRLRNVAAKVPLNRLLIETDSPYLAPVPWRGKPNEPRYVIKVAETLADVRQMPLDDVIQITGTNYQQLFGSITSF